MQGIRGSEQRLLFQTQINSTGCICFCKIRCPLILIPISNAVLSCLQALARCYLQGVKKWKCYCLFQGDEGNPRGRDIRKAF